MSGRGYVVWPEGQPERAIFAPTLFSKWWADLGPMGLIAGLRGRRMCSCWPCSHDDVPIVVARRCERLVG